MPPVQDSRIVALEKQLKSAQKYAAGLEKQALVYKKQIKELRALVAEVKDHVDPTKKDIVLAVKQAASWAKRAYKILKAIF